MFRSNQRSLAFIVLVVVLALIRNEFVSCRDVPYHESSNHRKDMEVVFNPSVNVVNVNVINRKLWTLKLTNMAYSQPFGPIFVLGHNSSSTPLYTIGNSSSKELEFLAERGSPELLVKKYTHSFGVKATVTVGSPTEPLFPGKSIAFQFETSDTYPYISIATMAVNTNDCFAGFRKLQPHHGLTVDSPGYDAGTEINDELCIHVPGPACVAYNQTHTDDDGEGFIHVHRGVHGIGDLDASIYDWRNPMLQIQIARVY